jgi:hypothetical protein
MPGGQEERAKREAHDREDEDDGDDQLRNVVEEGPYHRLATDSPVVRFPARTALTTRLIAARTSPG